MQPQIRKSTPSVCWVQRPSVRINLDGDVPSVPIPLHKRKPSLKHPPASPPRVSLLVPQKAAKPAPGKRSPESSPPSVPSLFRSDSSSGVLRASSATRRSLAGWVLGEQKARSTKQAVLR